MRPLRFAPFLILPLAVGCNSSSSSYKPKAVIPAVPPAKVAAGKEATLMPLRAGASWTYDMEQKAQRGGQVQTDRRVVEWKITKANTNNGVTIATMEMWSGGTLMDRQTWRGDRKGIFQVQLRKQAVAYDPPMPVIPYPVTDGHRTTWKGRGLLPIGAVGTMDAKMLVLGSQEVDLGTGRTSAIAIETRNTFKYQKLDGLAGAISWFQPGVGLVRYRNETVVGNLVLLTTLKLKKTTEKG